MNDKLKTMRDAFIGKVYEKMKRNKRIFFLSADLGAPALDRLRKDFKDRFINVGIAEQNLIEVSAGLALEGYVVYAYGISPFVTMRAYEPIRQTLSITSQIRKLNINIIGIGTGLSYNLSGPSHHCLEDLSIMRLLPNFIVFSPSDWVLAEKFVDYSIKIKLPKYLRFDGKALPPIYHKVKNLTFKNGFHELAKGKKICLVSTGFMTHRALKVIEKINSIGLIDVFLLKPLNENLLLKHLENYNYIITLEEGFINCGGLDSLISKIIQKAKRKINLINLGFKDRHVFELGDRDYLHKLNNLDEDSIIKVIKSCY
jgi:transketolase